MNEITDFTSFLAVARQQAEPQRLLFVFVRSVLPEDADESEIERHRAGEGGALMPVMYVDKAPAEIESFDALREESRQHAEEWDIVLAAALACSGGLEPAAEDVDEAFNAIITNIHAGGDLSDLLAFDREGIPLQFHARE